MAETRPTAKGWTPEISSISTTLRGRPAADRGTAGICRADMWYDVALVDLEMAPLLLAEGATARVKQRAVEG